MEKSLIATFNASRMLKTAAAVLTCTFFLLLAPAMAHAYSGSEALAAKSPNALGTTSVHPLMLGQTFVKSGNTYKVVDIDDDGDLDEVQLVKYGSTNKKPVINTVKFRGQTYKVDSIGRNAFNNARGHAVKSVTLGKHVDVIGAKAFYNCARLQMINLAKSDVIDIEKSRGSYYLDDIDIGAKAFSKAGVKNVTVKCGESDFDYQVLYKNTLMKKGLRADANIVK